MEQLADLLTDEKYREALAAQAYLRERDEEARVDGEHDLGATYFVLDWESLSDDARRPYRTAVAEALDGVLQVVTAAV